MVDAALRWMAAMRLSRIAVDITPLRESRDFRLLVLGLVTGLGTQATLVALPYQVYVDHRLGLPHRADRRRRAAPAGRRLALGGALADRFDRRRLLLSASSPWSRSPRRSRWRDLAGDAAGLAALPPGRGDGRRRGGRAGGARGDRPQHGRARAPPRRSH